MHPSESFLSVIYLKPLLLTFHIATHFKPSQPDSGFTALAFTSREGPCLPLETGITRTADAVPP
jgi:hypothetical protein